MTMSLTSPVNGSAQTGLTTPTYTLVTDVAPDINGKQYAVSALGGTQTGVVASTVSIPFTVNLVRPKVLKPMASKNPITGVLNSNPVNTYKVITRKGVTVDASSPTAIATVTTTITIPSGADSNDPTSLRAMLSLHIGSLMQASAGIGDTTVTGVS